MGVITVINKRRQAKQIMTITLLLTFKNIVRIFYFRNFFLIFFKLFKNAC